MKSTYDYSFHQHQLLSAAALARQHEPLESALDLTKRRDSVESETRKTTSPSSFEESPNARNSPNHAAAQLLLHRHLNIPKLPALSPEHSIQYHPYNFDHSSPFTTTTAMIKNSRSRTPPQMFESTPIITKLENISPPPNKSHSPHHMYERFESAEKSVTPPIHQMPAQIRPPVLDHEDSNELPSAMGSNISSSSSVASSQKSPTSSNSSMMVVGRDGKLSRPFKAYPRDPLSLAAAGSILDGTSAEKYAVFRKRMLEQIHAANGGNPVVNNPKMRRISGKCGNIETNNNEPLFASSEKILSKTVTPPPSHGNDKDEAYFERRKKNNAAAKKSRDRRRIKEDEIAIRAAFLERENIELKFELAAARKQLSLYGVTAGHN